MGPGSNTQTKATHPRFVEILPQGMRLPRVLSSIRIFWLTTALLAAVACSQAVGGPVPSSPTTTSQLSPTAVPETRSDPAPRSPTGPPPKVDSTIASVLLENVVFDTFDGGFMRLSEAGDSAIEGLRDRIVPVYEPRYDAVEGGDWLQDDDMVIGYASETDAYAYPVKILNLHEIVNDVIDGVPVLVSYCPLCASGVVYSRELDGQVMIFGNTSALYESDLVMYDHLTGSYWFQVIGEAIVGPLTGKRLKLLPSVTTTWGRWKALHAGTKVLSRNLGLPPRSVTLTPATHSRAMPTGSIAAGSRSRSPRTSSTDDCARATWSSRSRWRTPTRRTG